MALSKTEQEAVEQAKEIFANNNGAETTIHWSDPSIEDYVDLLRKSKVRFALLSDADIVADVNSFDNTVTLYSVNAGSSNSGSANKAATKTVSKPKKRGRPRKKKQEEEKQEEIQEEKQEEVQEKTQVEAPKKKKRGQRHTYHMPPEHELIKSAVQDPSSLIVAMVGPTGSGKTHYTKLLAEEMNMEHYHVTCRKDMDSASFFGDKTVEVDEKTGQNFIKFIEGPVTRAMQCGLDEDGNEVGKPALLVIDEFPIIPSWLGVGLNNLMDNFSSRRRLMIDADGGRTVTSHSGFRIVLLGNTIGRGLTGFGDGLYTAQGDALDISTLDRIDAIFQFGYNRKAEESILREKIGNDRVVKEVLKFRDAIRQHRQREPHTMQTPFSTRCIVTIADLYEVWGNIGDAIWYGIMSRLPRESADPRELSGEAAIYNETVLSVFGKDIHSEKVKNSGFDF